MKKSNKRDNFVKAFVGQNSRGKSRIPYKMLMDIKAKTPPHKYACTSCEGDAFIGWENRTKKDQDYFGAILKAGERLCLVCGKKRGIRFF